MRWMLAVVLVSQTTTSNLLQLPMVDESLKCQEALSQKYLLKTVKDADEFLNPPVYVDAVYRSPGANLRLAAEAADRRDALAWRVRQVMECSK